MKSLATVVADLQNILKGIQEDQDKALRALGKLAELAPIYIFSGENVMNLVLYMFPYLALKPLP